MRVQFNAENLEWLFVGGGELLAAKPWEASERDWVWSLRFLCWRYLIQADGGWTTTEDCYELPPDKGANQLRRGALAILKAREVVRLRRSPDRPGEIEFSLGQSREAAAALTRLWRWLTENTPQLGPPPSLAREEDRCRGV
jgi:hypothetical protein